MDAARKKELKDAYKSRQVVGGICSIRCSGNQNVRIQATADIEGSRNRFDFAVLTGTWAVIPVRCSPICSLKWLRDL